MNVTETTGRLAVPNASSPAPAPDKLRPHRWTRRRWRLVVAGVVLVLLVCFHAPLLRLLAGGLVVDEPLEATDAVVLTGASGPYQAMAFAEAAALYKEGKAHAVVLIEDRSSRLVRTGVVPTLEAQGRHELTAAGVPEDALCVLPGAYGTAWDIARRLGQWLEEHPGTTVTVLCDEFHSRRACGIYRDALGPEAAGRVRWRALPDRRFGVANWWQSRQGIVECAGAYVALAHANVCGEPPRPTETWDPDSYERQLGAAGR